MQQESGQYDKLIWSIVHKLLAKTNDKYYYNGLEEDLFQEGYVGLLSALEKYDDNLNIQFSTFAYKYIYGFCLNYLKKEFNSLKNEDIDSSPILSDTSYELDEYFQLDLIQELNNRLKVVNKKIPMKEENILKDRLYKEYSLKKCAELNDCSTRKVSNVINKYKDLIKDILNN
ncbi:MAG: sigma-70 family RNA polymerase sigma factor [Clostridia bacterium]